MSQTDPITIPMKISFGQFVMGIGKNPSGVIDLAA
jgi:hypothetical protein